MTTLRIDVSVEELVLKGIPAAEGRQIETEIERELARLLASGGPLAVTDGGAGIVNGGAFALGRDSIAAAVGARVARSVYRRVSR
jgi:hypothetical protein